MGMEFRKLIAINPSDLLTAISTFADIEESVFSYFEKSGISCLFTIMLTRNPNGSYSFSGSNNNGQFYKWPASLPGNTPIGAIVMMTAGVEYSDGCLTVAVRTEQQINFKKMSNLDDAIKLYFKL